MVPIDMVDTDKRENLEAKLIESFESVLLDFQSFMDHCGR